MSTYPEWTDIRFFLEVARTGRLSSAANRIGVEHSTVSRRIDHLEHQLGAVLFDRRRSGYSIAEAGRALIPHAEAMESALLRAVEETSANSKDVVGTLRVGTAEAFGVCVLAPRLIRLREQHPRLRIELKAHPQSPSLESREVGSSFPLNAPKRAAIASRGLPT